MNDTDQEQISTPSDSKIQPRPKRAAAAKAMTRITEWTDTLHFPPEKCRE